MPRSRQAPALIEFKGTTLPMVVVTLHSLQWQKLAEAAQQLFGDDEFFEGDAALIDLSKLEDGDAADWSAISKVLKIHGLNVIGVRGGGDRLRQSAATAGLPTYTAGDRPPRPAADDRSVEAPPPVEPADPTPSVASEAPSPEEKAVVETKSANRPLPTHFVDRPLRSGQQIYARGANLVVMAAVNAGAEVIADGDIHIYAPLHGRALAGASGETQARIFCTHFDAELVSIAGLYRTFDDGTPEQLAGNPAQVRLLPGADGRPDTLLVDRLTID
ncbi:MAG: septum site-determining protein MinC [Candidatus Accumulibacter sp.]|nr:septum site-determining protein MinC [Accumulibacter sp.]